MSIVLWEGEITGSKGPKSLSLDICLRKKLTLNVMNIAVFLNIIL